MNRGAGSNMRRIIKKKKLSGCRAEEHANGINVSVDLLLLSEINRWLWAQVAK